MAIDTESSGRMPRIILIFSAALLLIGCAAETDNADRAAITESPAIQLTGRVVDDADIFSAQFEEQLTAQLSHLESATKVQLVIVTVQSLGGAPIDIFTRDLANQWGIGHRDRDDGLIILVAPNERKVRIGTGLGLEESVTDEEAQMIIERDMIPHFQNGDYETAVKNAADSLAREVTPIEWKDAA